MLVPTGVLPYLFGDKMDETPVPSQSRDDFHAINLSRTMHGWLAPVAEYELGVGTWQGQEWNITRQPADSTPWSRSEGERRPRIPRQRRRRSEEGAGGLDAGVRYDGTVWCWAGRAEGMKCQYSPPAQMAAKYQEDSAPSFSRHVR